MNRLIALDDIQDGIGTIEKGSAFGVTDPYYAEQLLGSGKAKRAFDAVRNSRGWDGLLWDGATVVIMASGPTLSAEQCEVVFRWRHEDPRSPLSIDTSKPFHHADRKTIAVNTTFNRAPWADVIYGGDDRWWRFHWDNVARCAGDFFALDHTLHNLSSRIRLLKHEVLPGLGTKPGVIREGGNSGHQAVCLAYWAGAARIVLLGFDCHGRGGSHWHGDHPPALHTRNQYKSWIAKFGVLADDLRQLGVEVVNCSPDSDLESFTKAPLEEALGLVHPKPTEHTNDEGSDSHS